jgi:hypothetical protein
MLKIHSSTCAQVCAADQAQTVHSGLHTPHAATVPLHGPAHRHKGEVCLRAHEANWATIFILFCLRFQFFDIVEPVGYILGILSLVMILNFPAFL